MLSGAGAEPLGRERSWRERPLAEGTRAWPRHDWRPNHKRPDMLGLSAIKDAVPVDRVETLSSLKSARPSGSTAAAEDVRNAVSAKVQARYARGEAERPTFGGRPPLPSDTAEREWAYYTFPEFRDSIETKVAPFHGRDSMNLAPTNGAFPWRVGEAPQARLTEDVPLFNRDRRSFYGNYVGPDNGFSGDGPPPLTPVDRAAWYHDREYADIYQRYGYSEFEYGLSFTREIDQIFGSSLSSNDGAVQAFGWLGQTTSLDPAMQLELAWADAKIIGRSGLYIGEGLFSGFYSGKRGRDALATDLAWGAGIAVFHAALIAWRLGAMLPAGVMYQTLRGAVGLISSLGNAIGGDIGRAVRWVGDLAGRVVNTAALAFSFVSTIGAGAVVLAGATAGAVVGGIVYVAGKAVGGVIESVGDVIDDACFITTAVSRTTGEDDDGPTLTLLRRFRDEYVVRSPTGRRLAILYTEIAPRIVHRIEQSVDPTAAWRRVHHRWISPALGMIEAENHVGALRLYVDMVRALAREAAVPLSFDGSRAHWKRDYRLRL